MDSFELHSELTSSSDTAPNPSRIYSAVWRPKQAGTFVLSLDEPNLADLDVHQSVHVEHPDDEFHYASADYERLQALADATGGKLIGLDELDQLANLLPPQPDKVTISIKETLWDCPLSLMMIALLLTVEWVGRKMIRLV